MQKNGIGKLTQRRAFARILAQGTGHMKQKSKMSHHSADSHMIFQNIQLFIVVLWVHPVHSYFQGLLRLQKTPLLTFEIFKFLPTGGAGYIYLFFCSIMNTIK